MLRTRIIPPPGLSPLLAAALLLPGLTAFAAPPAEQTATTGAETAPGVAVEDLESLRPKRPPLLREGSHLVEVTGHLQWEPEIAQWRFHISREDPHSPGYSLSLLPCTLLGEMVAIVDSMPRTRVTFETTGEVFVFKNRNYFLPTHPPRLVRHEQLADEPRETPSADSPESSGASPPPAEAEGGDSAEDIMRRLDEAVGEIAPPRTDTAAPRAQNNTTSAGGPVIDQRRGAGRERLMREGTVLLARRGSIRRDAGGAWTFVFDADASGLADPPMTLLPCLLLERIERHVRRAGEHAPALISGDVYVYNNRNYLLPTVFRIPREHTKLMP